VKYGDNLGLFPLRSLIAAVIITWRRLCNIHACSKCFRSKENTTEPKAHGEEFHLQHSEYTDNTTIIFNNREDLEE